MISIFSDSNKIFVLNNIMISNFVIFLFRYKINSIIFKYKGSKIEF